MIWSKGFYTNRLVSDIYGEFLNNKLFMNKYTRQINIIKNNDLETLEKFLHDDFMFIRESGLVTRDEFINYMNIKILRSESGGLQFLDFKVEGLFAMKMKNSCLARFFFMIQKTISVSLLLILMHLKKTNCGEQ